jgi:hypothetical protein
MPHSGSVKLTITTKTSGKGIDFILHIANYQVWLRRVKRVEGFEGIFPLLPKEAAIFGMVDLLVVKFIPNVFAQSAVFNSD